MPGIEKVCEVSGADVGWEMYGYKRNSIQVLPEHRSCFKNKAYTFYYWKERINFIYKGGCSELLDDVKEFKNSPYFQKGQGKFAREYGYVLNCPEVLGQVNGCYLNYTTDFKAMKHNIRKLLGLKGLYQLKVVELKSYEDFVLLGIKNSVGVI